MSLTSIYQRVASLTVALGAAVLGTGCGTISRPMEAAALPTPKYVAGASLTKPIEVEVCDRLGFEVLENTRMNRRALEQRSWFFGDTIAEHNGYLIKYNVSNFSKMFTFVGGALAKNGGTSGIILGALFGATVGKEVDRFLTPAQLADFNACRSRLNAPHSVQRSDDADQVPTRRRDYRRPSFISQNDNVPNDDGTIVVGGMIYDPLSNVLTLENK